MVRPLIWLIVFQIYIVPAIGGLLHGNEQTPPSLTSRLQYDPKVSAHNLKVLEQVAQILFNRCENLKKYSADIISVKAKVLPWNGMMIDYGWSHVARVIIQVKQDPQQIPARLHEGGQTLYLTMGGAPRPGIAAGKHAGARMCLGMPSSRKVDYPDMFLSVPKLKVVDSLKIKHN